MTTSEVQTLVVGAGVAGLGAALELERQGCETLLVDAYAHPGGVMATDEIRGYRVERGPNTFQIKAPLHGFLRDHALESSLCPASPESRKRFILRSGKLVPVPMDPLRFAGSPLLSTAGKLRLLAEPFVAGGDASGESVADFVTRRLGPQATSALVGPFLTGVYAGDEQKLGVEAVFPALVELEREHGGIVRGLVARGLHSARAKLMGRGAGQSEAEAAGLSGTWSAPEGLGQFARTLAARLRQPARLGTRVVELARDGSLWRAQLQSGAEHSEVRARGLVLAAPAAAASALLKGLDPQAAAALDAIEYAPIVSVGLGVDPGRVREPLDGFGFLVPREERLGLLGCLFMSRLFPNRAPADRELLHCMLGGVRWPEAVDQSDDVLCERLEGELDRTLGLMDAPERLVVHRWPRAVPQPSNHHPGVVASLRARTRGLGAAGSGATLELAGSYLDGVSVADSLASGVAAARIISATVSTQSA